MPFEPLRTDEKLPTKQKAARDMDSVMLTGCTGFVSASLLTYFVGVWPFMAFQDTHLAATLGLCALVGLLPATLLGVIASRKFELPGACGFVGGSMALSVFLYLRLQQVMLGKSSADLPRPDYPASWVWAIPLGWLVVSILVAVLTVPRIDPGGNDRP
jgi:hypothetical protein